MHGRVSSQWSVELLIFGWVQRLESSHPMIVPFALFIEPIRTIAKLDQLRHLSIFIGFLPFALMQKGDYNDYETDAYEAGDADQVARVRFPVKDKVDALFII